MTKWLLQHSIGSRHDGAKLWALRVVNEVAEFVADRMAPVFDGKAVIMLAPEQVANLVDERECRQGVAPLHRGQHLSQ